MAPSPRPVGRPADSPWPVSPELLASRRELAAAMEAVELRMHEDMLFLDSPMAQLLPPETVAKVRRSADRLADALALVRQQQAQGQGSASPPPPR